MTKVLMQISRDFAGNGTATRLDERRYFIITSSNNGTGLHTHAVVATPEPTKRKDENKFIPHEPWRNKRKR